MEQGNTGRLRSTAIESQAKWVQAAQAGDIDMARARKQAGSSEGILPSCGTGVPARASGSQGQDALATIVREAIDRLPASMKEVVILRYYSNCSYERISAVLGLSKTSINGRLTRAKRKLARHLRRRGVLEDMP